MACKIWFSIDLFQWDVTVTCDGDMSLSHVPVACDMHLGHGTVTCTSYIWQWHVPVKYDSDMYHLHMTVICNTGMYKFNVGLTCDSCM